MYNATRVPDSCCLEFSDSCGSHEPGTWWKSVRAFPSSGGRLQGCGPQVILALLQPCYETVKAWLQENLLAVGIFGLCTALVQVSSAGQGLGLMTREHNGRRLAFRSL